MVVVVVGAARGTAGAFCAKIDGAGAVVVVVVGAARGTAGAF